MFAYFMLIYKDRQDTAIHQFNALRTTAVFYAQAGRRHYGK
jgi:hypothetical protein